MNFCHLVFIKRYLELYTNILVKNDKKKETLELLGKGNIKRRKRLENNKLIIINTNISIKLRLKAYYENIYLSRIIKGDYKFAYLLLGMTFIYRRTLNRLFRLILNDNQMNELVKPLDEALEFFEFTYLSPSKIANSCAICIYQYLTHYRDMNEEEILKTVRALILEHFPEHSHVKLRADNFKREIYCAGIYNGMPIFQWYTSTKKEFYYSEKDISKYHRYIKKSSKDIGLLKPILVAIFTKNLKEDKYSYETKEGIRKIINNLSITYIKSFVSEIEYQKQKNKRKPIKYYLVTPIRLIVTILTRSITKSALK